MAENTDRKFTLSHRMLIAAIAAIVIRLFNCCRTVQPREFCGAEE